MDNSMKPSTASKMLAASSSAAWMERLRAKAASFRASSDLSRATRTALLDRRNAPDAADRVVLRSSLDQLSSAVPARDAASLADRLEAISRQVASRWAKRGVATLNFMAAPVHGCYYLSTDCFYVEIYIEGTTGRVVEAKVHHIDSNHPNQQTNPPKNCPEIIDCLTKGDFAMFVDHLEGLMAIYDMPNASAQDKTRGWNALSILEHDLIKIDRIHNFSAEDDVSPKINFGPLGFIQPRAGGLSLKMTYFVPTQDLVDVPTKSFRKLTASIITEENIGYSLTVGLDRTNQPMALPVSSLISSDGKELPISPGNSVPLPARFILTLGQEMPLEVSKYHEIVSLTGIGFIDHCENSPGPLLHLITKSASDGVLESSNNRGLFVTLPDQSHCYFLTDHDNLKGHMVKTIPFSHPANIIGIVSILREQAAFNTIISSCVRTSGIQDLEKSILFEVNCMDLKRVCVTFEVSHDGGMASLELDFSSPRSIQCKLHNLSKDAVGPLETAAKAVFEKTLSLPLTMRALVKHLGKKPKLEPDPDPEYESVTQHFTSNGNLDNGNVIPMELDFGHRSVKNEPMDYENTDHLNANRPQDAALNPGARNNKVTTTLTPPQQPPTTKTSKTDQFSTKTGGFGGELEIKALKAKPLLSPSSRPSSVKNKIGSDIRPSVSITPVSSADPASTTISMRKSAAGIEIIPLGDKLPSDENSSKKSKESVKRSFSEDDKRRLERKDGSKTKRKRDHFSLKPDPDKKPRLDKKLSSVLDRLSSSSSHNDSGIEIIPASKYDKMKNNDPSSRSSSGLKLTIKSSSSSSSSSKHKSSSDYHRDKSKSSSSSKSYSSSANKRSSPSMSQMMKYPNKPASKEKVKDRDKQLRDKDRIEEVKRLLGSNKLDTTFQIPKRTKPDEKGQSKSANASPKAGSSPSPKYGVSPKHPPYPGTISPPNISPKHSSSSSSSMRKTPPSSSSPSHNPPPVLSSAASAPFMSLQPRNAPSPPNLAAFEKAGCDLNSINKT